VKQIESIFRTFLGILILFLTTYTTPAVAQRFADPDSVEISLITCSPHNEIYSLYGHSALRVRDVSAPGYDFAFNWGVFNPRTSNFTLLFALGITNYELGYTNFRDFCQYYRRWGCRIDLQVINLTREEKTAVMRQLGHNLEPQNLVYRYNIFYDNCSTRPRDIIERAIAGKIDYKPAPNDNATTYRSLIHRYNKDHRWSAMGIDLLLGLHADKPLSAREQQFLPKELHDDFTQATVERADGRQPLVAVETAIESPHEQQAQQPTRFTPTVAATLLLIATLVISFLEWWRHRSLHLFDLVLAIARGAAGCVLVMMIFSQHPTTSLNLQLLVLNPLPMLFIPAILKHRKSKWYVIDLVLTTAFIIGGFFQNYAEGMNILALCLLIRNISLMHEL